MVRLALLSLVLATAMISSILASGCTGEKGASQPPASTLTLATRRPATPAPETAAPVVTTATKTPSTPWVTLAVTPGTISQGSRVRIVGRVTGLRSGRGTFIDEIRFTVALVPRAEPVDFEIPTTQVVFTKFGEQFSNIYLITGRRNDNGDSILEEGESLDISVPIQPPYEIFPGQNFVMAIKVPQTDVTVTAQAPLVLNPENILA